VKHRAYLALTVAIALGAAPSRAAPTKAACAEAYQKGQEQRRDGELRAAASSFALCSDPACPSALRADCEPWRVQAEQSIPSLAIKVVGAAATVRLDGEPVVSGASIQVDPGAHVVRAEADGFETAELTLKVRAGERDVPVVLTLRAKPKGSPASPSASSSSSSSARPFPSSSLVFGVAGVAALGAFGFFGLRGDARKADLAACKPACDPARGDDVKRDYLFADASLGVGVLMLGLATYSFVTRPTASEARPPVALAVTTTGFALSLGGRF
jgi:hypothetical protein